MLSSRSWLLLLVIACSLLGICSELATGSLDFTEELTFDVLLTGFLPGLNWTFEPSGEVAQQLSSVCEDVALAVRSSESAKLRICWHAKILPVSHTGIRWLVEHFQSFESQAPPYHAVIHMGLENNSKGINLEIAAANIQANSAGVDGTQSAMSDESDVLATTVNLGWLSLSALLNATQSVSSNAPELQTSFATMSWPSLDPIVKVNSHGVTQEETEMWRHDHGRYFHNELYYRTLWLIRSRGLLVQSGAFLPAIFVQLPGNDTYTVDEDMDAIRQIAAQIIWGSHIVGPPGENRTNSSAAASAPDSAEEEGSTVRVAMSFVAAVVAVLAVFALGVVFGAWFWGGSRDHDEQRN